MDPVSEIVVSKLLSGHSRLNEDLRSPAVERQLKHVVSALVKDTLSFQDIKLRKEDDLLNHVKALTAIIKHAHQQQGTTFEELNLASVVEQVCFPTLQLFDESKEQRKLLHAICELLLIIFVSDQCGNTGDINIEQARRLRNELVTWCKSSLKRCESVKSHPDGKSGLLSETCAIEVLNFLSGAKQPQSFKVAHAGQLCLLSKDDMEDIFCILLDIVQQSNLNITARILGSLMSKIFNLDTSEAVCRVGKVYDLAMMFISKESPDSDNIYTNKAFLILCALSDYIFPNQATSIFIDVRKDFRFWSCIQMGLINSDNLTQKRSMYLLKRALDVTKHVRETIRVDHKVSGSIFFWSSETEKESDTLWNDFILLMETLEEKQVHVLSPLMPRINHIIRTTLKDGHCLLHTSWLWVLFCKIQRHDSTYVKKWGTGVMLDLDLKQCPLLEQNEVQSLIGPLLLILKEPGLYMSVAGSPPFIAEQLTTFLQSTFDALNEKERGLSSLPSSPMWDKKALGELRECMTTLLRTSEPCIREAIICFMVTSALKHANLEEVSMKDLASVLAVLTLDSVFGRGTPLHVDCATWMTGTFVKKSAGLWSQERAAVYLTDSLQRILNADPADDNQEVQKFVRMLVLLVDAGILDIKNQHESITTETILQPVVDTLRSINSRAYMSINKAKQALQILTVLLKDTEAEAGDELHLYAHHLVDFCCPDSVLFVKRSVETTLHSPDQLETLDIYIQSLYWFLGGGSRYKKQQPDVEVVKDLIQCAVDIMMGSVYNKKKTTCMVQQIVAMEMFYMVGAVVLACNVNQDEVLLGKISLFWDNMKDAVKGALERPSDTDDSVITGLTDRGLFISKFLAAEMKCVKMVLQIGHGKCSGYICKELLEKCSHAISVLSRECLIPAMQCANLIIPMAIEEDEMLVTHILRTLWTKTEEERKTALYWEILQEFCSLAFQPALLMCARDSRVIETLNEIINSMFSKGETKNGILNPAIREMCKFFSTNNTMQYTIQHVDLLVSASLYGPVWKKNQKIYGDICSYVESLGEKVAINQLMDRGLKEDNMVRVHVLNLLSHLDPNNSHHHQFSVAFLHSLHGKHMELVKTEAKRSFPNSLQHRQRHRLMGALLVLEPMLDREDAEDLFQTLVSECLGSETQPSVRYLTQWLVIRLVFSFPHLRQRLWEMLNKATESRPAIVCSLISVLVHLGLIVPKEQQVDYFVEAIPNFVPWCMAHHFNIRIHAHAAINKIWRICKEQQYVEVLQNYAWIEKCVDFYLTSSGASKNTHKLMDGFWFLHKFSPIQDYSLETIFHTIPRLTSVTTDEWILPKDFLHKSLSCSGDGILPVHNPRDDLKDCEPGTWNVKRRGEESEEIYEGDVQKKVIPWKQMIPSDEEDVGRSLHHPGQLILVTSLIDRPPNLGGLCRTSEIFRVSEYVIGNMKYVEDKGFQSLCVTSDKWIPIKEVPPHKLHTYLMEMQSEGYTLVGVEQTANSVNLTDYQFPTKTLLLLGNEKRGIPVDLIQLLDVCVEIPQQGVVRSLNVHVSGALLIWEYRRQQLIKAKTP